MKWLHNFSGELPFAQAGPAAPGNELSTLLTLTVVAGFFLLLMLETRLNRGSHRTAIVRQSYRTNLATLLFNDVLMSVLSVSSLLLLAERYSDFGLLSGIDSVALKGILAFVLLDLALYLQHRAAHRFDTLWFFHRVHHSDRSVNVSTAFRLHAGEVLLTTLTKAAFIVAMGVDVALVAINEAIVTLFVMFHHANISFKGERWLSQIMVVPALHRLHHSVLREEHDNNYGYVFSIWDRLFRTLQAKKPASVGLAFVPGQSFRELLKYGIGRGPELSADELAAMVAEAAYYKAEKRGFKPGRELNDWLEAEREVSDSLTLP